MDLKEKKMKKIDALRLLGDIVRGEVEINVARSPRSKCRVWVECCLSSDKVLLGAVPSRIFSNPKELHIVDIDGIIIIDEHMLRYKPKKKEKNRFATYPDVKEVTVDCTNCGHSHEIGDEVTVCRVCALPLYNGLHKPIKGY